MSEVQLATLIFAGPFLALSLIFAIGLIVISTWEAR
jgi:hypothetical protein